MAASVGATTDAQTPAPTPATSSAAPTPAPTPAMVVDVSDMHSSASMAKATNAAAPVLVEQVGEPIIPFTLQHQALAHTIGVSIGQPLIAMVASRPDLDFVLRCTHGGLANSHIHRHGRKQGGAGRSKPFKDSHSNAGTVSFKNESWPNVGMMLAINEHSPIKPQPMDGLLFVTEMLKVGLNVIRMKTPKCCCMHKFELLVAQTLDHGAIRKSCLLRSVDVATSLAHVRHMKPPKPSGTVSTTTTATNFGSSGSSGSEQHLDPRMKTSLRCPISYQRMAIPVRGRQCHHFQCFDLDSYLEKGAADGCWQCPVCNKPTPTSSLVRDDFVSLILANADRVPAASARCPGMDSVFVHAFYPENWQSANE